MTWFCSPSERDLKHLRADYAGAQTLKNCLPPHAHLEGSAAIVVAAKIHDLPVIADVLLPLAGFKRPTRVLLARRPASPDVTDAEVLIAAERGDIGSSAPEGWLDDVNPIEIAEMLYRDASWTCTSSPPRRRRRRGKESRCVINSDDSWFELAGIR